MRHRLSIVAVLVLVTVAAGCARRGGSAPTPPAGRTGDGGQLPTVNVVLRDFEFEPKPIRVKPGTVRFLLENRGAVQHDFAIPSLQGHGDHDAHVVKPGKTGVVELELTPGSYEAICAVPGHKEAGMSVTVEVGN